MGESMAAFTAAMAMLAAEAIGTESPILEQRLPFWE